MCAGAIIQARVARVVYGATDPKAGAVHSLFQTLQDSRLNHRCELKTGILGEECGGILKEYFRKKRAAKKAKPSSN
jgi:tRNA(adenine34) deaminase